MQNLTDSSIKLWSIKGGKLQKELILDEKGVFKQFGGLSQETNPLGTPLTAPQDWVELGVADLNGDGLADTLWQHKRSINQLLIWDSVASTGLPSFKIAIISRYIKRT